MPLLSLDHVNIRTANLQAMVDWYAEVLDMHPGWRPEFGFGGAWLYADGKPIVHLVEVDRVSEAEHPGLEHFAVSATGMAGFLSNLRDRDVPYQLAPVPDAGVVQVNIHDPDGNHIHIDFPTEEAEGLS